MLNNRTCKLILGILFFGSLWGFSEASLGGWLYSRDISHASVYLTVIALVIIALAHASLSHRWTGTLTGLFAMLFKLINIPFFPCHLWAILLLGFGFDISLALVPRFYSGRFRLPVIGLVSVYVGHALFALTITYVWQYHYWTAAGLPRVIDYIFISGSVAALLGAVAVPVGNRIGISAGGFSWAKLHPRLSSTGVLAATFGIWVLQRVI